MGLIWTQDEVRAFLRARGMSPRVAYTGSAIACCEAPYPKNAAGEPRVDFGLVADQDLADDVYGFTYGMGIRSLRAEKGTGGWRDEEQLVRPRFNMRAAQAIHDAAAGWSDWTTFNEKQYRAYMQDVFPPPPNTYVVQSGDTISSIAAGLEITEAELLAVQDPPLADPNKIYIGQHLDTPEE